MHLLQVFALVKIVFNAAEFSIGLLVQMTTDFVFHIITNADYVGRRGKHFRVCLFVCLFGCLQHNSKMNDPKEFKLGP